MDQCKLITTPTEVRLNLIRSEEKSTVHPYRELIGNLIYATLVLIPDLCYVVNYFSQFQTVATDVHWIHLK